MPKAKIRTTQTAFRLPNTLLRRMKAVQAYLEERRLTLSLAKVAVMALEIGLDGVETKMREGGWPT